MSKSINSMLIKLCHLRRNLKAQEKAKVRRINLSFEEKPKFHLDDPNIRSGNKTFNRLILKESNLAL